MKFLKDTKAKNLIDDRDLFFMADITCTNGNAGRVWVLFNGSDMNFCGFDGFSKAGELLETMAKLMEARAKFNQQDGGGRRMGPARLSVELPALYGRKQPPRRIIIEGDAVTVSG